MTRYVKRLDEEGWSVPSGELYRIGCCDCGLVHDFIFVSNDGEPIGIAARRNNRATAQKRRGIAKFKRMGGPQWLRDKIDKAKEQT
jgi:hypothetical protein